MEIDEDEYQINLDKLPWRYPHLDRPKDGELVLVQIKYAHDEFVYSFVRIVSNDSIWDNVQKWCKTDFKQLHEAYDARGKETHSGANGILLNKIY